MRELLGNPEQQAASAYMNDLNEAGSEDRLAADDFAMLWNLFTRMGATDPKHPGGGWLTDEVRAQYRAVWSAGLTGPVNYYRASPLRPAREGDAAAANITLPREMLTIAIPTLVLWAMEDIALPPELIDGLEDYVADLTLERVEGASHWIIHERPAFVAQRLGAFLAARRPADLPGLQ